MKLFNKGKAFITYETKAPVIRDDKVIEKGTTAQLEPQKGTEVSDAVGKKLLRLYPTVLIDMDKVTASDLMVAQAGAPVAPVAETESPKAPKKA